MNSLLLTPYVNIYYEIIDTINVRLTYEESEPHFRKNASEDAISAKLRTNCIYK